MTVEPWWDQTTGIWIGAGVGSLIGLWGTVVGVAGGLLVPKGHGKGLVFGLLYAGLAVGLVVVVSGLTALVLGQPYHVWYPSTLPGALLLLLSVPFLFIMKARFREVELRKMQAQDIGGLAATDGP